MRPEATRPGVPAEDPGPRTVLDGARRVLVARLDNLGDVLMTGPVFRALREAVPDAELVLLGSPGGSAAAALLPWVDRVQTLRAVWQDAQGRLPLDPARELRAIDAIRGIDADAAIILTSFSQTPWPAAYACYLAGIPIRAGHAADFGGSLLTHRAGPNAPVHQADRNLHVLRALDVAVHDPSLGARVPRQAADAVSRLLAEGGLDGHTPPILVLPGASCAARRYPAERFAAAARLTRERTGLPVVVAGGERERELTAALAAAAPGALDLGGATDVGELAALVARAAVVLANDSFGMHVADALRVPVVTVFSGTDREAEWAPRDTASRTLRRSTTCAPCRLFECPIGLPCLDVPPEDVADAAVALLDGAGARSEVLPCAG
jgi:ADP-heptose:LPS heptosyltransferase